uniref:AAA_lid_3 domain-containing protein n=1 Tax=Ascaris lumbricoides TaxID=6252 RepID=A0A0M3I5L2_ASCLU
MLACHAGGPGPIPGRPNTFETLFRMEKSTGFSSKTQYKAQRYNTKDEHQKEKEHVQRRWFSGIMLACHAGRPGPIPGRRNTKSWLLKKLCEVLPEKDRQVSAQRYNTKDERQEEKEHEPASEERLSILKVLCRDVRLDSDVDLKYFAEKTCGYSGADLKGLVTTSQFHAIRSANLISKGNSKKDEGPLIRREDFDVTFAESSGKTKKKNKQHKIPCETGQRVTLA